MSPAASSAGSGFAAVRLHTPRLRLRPWRPDDAVDLYAMHTDPRVMRYWSTPPWAGLAQAHEAIAQDQAAMAAGRHLRLALARPDDDRLIGQCTLFNLVPACRRAEIGYALAASAWGQGLMHEALQALLAHGFDTMGLNRVEADIDPRNQASARALRRLGFQHEGTLRERWIVDGEVSDSALYGLLHRDWRAQAEAAATLPGP